MNLRSTRNLPRYLAHRWLLTLFGVGAVVLAVWPSAEDLARRLLSSGQEHQAQPLLERALAAATDANKRAELHELLGSIAENEGDGHAALEHLAGAAAEQPGVRLLIEKARIEQLLDHPAQEVEALKAADEVYTGWRKTGTPSLARMTAGLTLLEPSQLPLESTLKAAFEKWYLPHRVRLAKLLRWRQDREAALAMHRELAPRLPGDFALWSDLERLEAYSGNRAESLAALEHLAAIRPEDGRTAERIASRALEAKDADRAARWLLRAHLAPEELRRRVLAAYVITGQSEVATERYLALVPADRDEAAIGRALADAQLENGHARDAVARLEKLSAAHPEDAGLARRLAEALSDAKRPADAAAVLLRLVERDPQSFADGAAALARLRDVTEAPAALPALERLLQLLPGDHGVQRDLGIRYSEVQRHADAVALLEPAVARDAGDEDAAYYLAMSLAEVGRSKEAIELLRHVAHTPQDRIAPARGTDGGVVGAPLVDAKPEAGVAGPPPLRAGPVSRRVLALFKRSEGDSTSVSLVHERLEVVFDHLGLAVDYRAVEDGLPAAAELARYRGVVTWFHSGVMKGAAAYAKWLDGVLAAGVPAIVLEDLGCQHEADGTPLDPQLLEPIYARMGLEAGSRWSDDPTRFRVERAEPALVGFERPLGYDVDSFEQMQSISPANHVWLRLADTADPTRVCDAVVVGPWGAMVLSDHAFSEDPELETFAWRVDPFELARRALRMDGLPRLDVTTRMGLRAGFVHIDGDGSNQPLSDQPQYTCIEDFHNRVLPRRTLPHTVSLIGRLVDPALVDRRTLTAAQRTMRHPLVESAHHSYSHPFDWTKPDVSLVTPGYTQVDPQREIAGVRDMLDALVCPPDKPVKLILWSGQCNPTGPMLAIADATGLPNFNGGDPRMDAYHASVSHMAPLFRVVDGRLQTQTASANDFVYTDAWSLPRLAFEQVIETFKRTETPRRIAPVDLYYHFYLLAEPGGRAVLDRIYAWIEKQELHPLWGSTYVASTLGWRKGEVELTTDGAWRITQAGECRTVRFDREARHVDFARSSGVVGERRSGDTLYVHLDASGEARIMLDADAAALPHVAQATADVRALKRPAAGTIELEGAAIVAGRVQLAGGEAGALATVTLDAAGRTTSFERAWSAAGEVAFDVPVGAWRARVTTRMSAAAGAAGAPLQLAARPRR